MKYFFLSLFSMMAVALTGANSVTHAASIYDDNLDTVDSLSFDAFNSCPALNMPTFNELEDFINDDGKYTDLWTPSGTTKEDIRTSLQQGINLDKFVINKNDINKVINIYWVEFGDIQLEWIHPWDPAPKSIAVRSTLPNQTKHLMIICQSNTGNNWVWSGNISGFNGGFNDGLTVSDNKMYRPNNNKIFHFSGDPNYPIDYEGDDIPENAQSNIVSDQSPNWRIDQVMNFKLLARDTNFSTFDNPAFLCSQDGNTILDGNDSNGLAPVLHWQLFDAMGTQSHSDDVFLKDGTHNATGQLQVDLPDLEKNTQYRITGWYDCGGTVDFDTPSHKFFTMTKDGLLDESAVFAQCVTEEFPFVHLQTCFGNLSVMASLASFGTPQFANAWKPNQNCNTLQVLDDWIHLEGNPPLCPQVPNYVRAAVTPFVTFILGLITIKFIARMTGKEF